MHARLIRSALTGVGLVLSAGALGTGTGCLDRPVVPGEPTTKTNFTTSVAQSSVDKVDILFSIDNSASMGDKQVYLEKAIPDLVKRLVTPNCISNADNTTVAGVSSTSPTDGSADCSAFPNTSPEFPAVHNMHIGVVSSSLGPRLGDVAVDGKGGECPETDPITLPQTGVTGGTPVTIDRHNDDHAYLITRTATPPDPTETPSAAASNGFLAWFPNATANNGKDAGSTTPVTDPVALENDFSDIIAGVHVFGCGIESQLENWYRFLVQPDPYLSLALGTAKGGSAAPAQWVGVDKTILKQRHDFLRPDSLVAVIVLTDENDSEIDVRSIGQQGYLWMSTSYHPNQGTAACTDPSKGPNDPGCTINQASGAPQYTSPEDWGYDLNLRHVHMKAKYGLDPQFPITRYVNGLTSATVPDRQGEYPSGASNYQGTNDCTNPLFAASLPDGSELSASSQTDTTLSSADQAILCKLPASTVRTKSLVFYALIGGVPWQLLHFDSSSPANSALTDADWVRILGTNPDTWDYTGIDPHMIESYAPRNGTQPFTTAAPLGAISGATVGTSAAETAPAPAAGGNTDPYNGREWNTNTSANHIDLKVDREYACTFKLVDPTSGNPTPRDCTNDGTGNNYTVPANGPACDCSSTVGTGATDITPDQLSPLCDPANPNSQLYAKAYPTIRELNLANKLGTQGIVSSICPIDVADNASGDDPLFGYRPAVASIINRLKSALTNQCLPQTLQASDAGTGVPCLILATLPSGKQANCSDGTYGKAFSQPDPSILAQYQTSAHQAWVQGGSAGTDPSTLPTCEVNQITDYSSAGLAANGSCKESTELGWCYVEGAAAGTCAQAIIFSPNTLPPGSLVNLQCIESSSAVAAGATDGG